LGDDCPQAGGAALSGAALEERDFWRYCHHGLLRAGAVGNDACTAGGRCRAAGNLDFVWRTDRLAIAERARCGDAPDCSGRYCRRSDFAAVILIAIGEIAGWRRTAVHSL